MFALNSMLQYDFGTHFTKPDLDAICDELDPPRLCHRNPHRSWTGQGYYDEDVVQSALAFKGLTGVRCTSTPTIESLSHACVLGVLAQVVEMELHWFALRRVAEGSWWDCSSLQSAPAYVDSREAVQGAVDAVIKRGGIAILVARRGRKSSEETRACDGLGGSGGGEATGQGKRTTLTGLGIDVGSSLDGDSPHTVTVTRLSRALSGLSDEHDDRMPAARLAKSRRASKASSRTMLTPITTRRSRKDMGPVAEEEGGGDGDGASGSCSAIGSASEASQSRRGSGVTSLGMTNPMRAATFFARNKDKSGGGGRRGRAPATGEEFGIGTYEEVKPQSWPAKLAALWTDTSSKSKSGRVNPPTPKLVARPLSPPPPGETHSTATSPLGIGAPTSPTNHHAANGNGTSGSGYASALSPPSFPSRKGAVVVEEEGLPLEAAKPDLAAAAIRSALGRTKSEGIATKSPPGLSVKRIVRADSNSVAAV